MDNRHGAMNRTSFRIRHPGEGRDPEPQKKPATVGNRGTSRRFAGPGWTLAFIGLTKRPVIQ
jgi:hypothetical protein